MGKEIKIEEVLKDERKRQGLTLEKLAELSGVSKSMISRIESKKRSPSFDTVLLICGGLGIFIEIQY